MIKDISNLFVGFIAVVLLFVLLGYGSYQLYSFYAPRYAAIDNKVFHESAQYNDGMVRDLESLQLQYMNASTDQKDALKAVVIHRFSVYPEEKLPSNLRNFYNQLKGN